MYHCEPVSEVATVLGEGPYWEEKTRRLLYVDIIGKELIAFDSNVGKIERWRTPEMVSAVVPAKRGGYILTLEHRVVHFDERTQSFETLCELEANRPDNRINDAKCDARGRLWFGTMNKSAKYASGSLYRLDSDRTLTRLREEIVVSNGLGWSPDNAVMYYTDTQTYRLDEFDFDLSTGGIANRRIVISLPFDKGFSDGMAVDEEGLIWLALWRGAKVVRIDPTKGKIVDEVLVPAYLVTSVCFGGLDLNELYITSASIDLTDDLKKQYPLSGRLFRVKLGIRGLAGNSFVG